ncbi:MAG TPA: RodZ domain-containing protein [Vicinamibacterales bacterium]|nr:RodZ domain-containing protein [Vicinamibacterales bacterium]
MSVGARLAAARAARAMSLEDLARRTRIPLNGLRALEADAYERLPPPVYVRGYLRACAAEVGLDPQSLVAQFDRERPPEPAELAALRPPEPLDDVGSAWSYRSRRIASIVAAAGMIALVIWTGREPSGRTATPDASETAAAVAPQPVGTTGRSTPVAPTPPEGEGVTVVLTAERECWVTASADAERVIYRLMRAGEREAIQADGRVVLRVGDAGAVSMSVNGSAPEAAGPDGAVRTIVLTPEDARRARATPAAAPGATAQAN